MRRSTSLLSAAWLCLAAASIGGRASAAPPKVLVLNDSNEDVLITITDLNAPHGALIEDQWPLDAHARLFVDAKLDRHGVYHLHWKTQDPARTKAQEGDCQAAAAVACHVQLFFP